MVEWEAVRKSARPSVKEALRSYGSLLTDDPEALRKAVDQSVNFFESLLTLHKPKPPFENKKLSDIAPNRRQFFSGPSFRVSPNGEYSWMSCLVERKLGYFMRSLFSTQCVQPPAKTTEMRIDDVHFHMQELVEERGDPFFDIAQLKWPIPHTIKAQRTHCKFYGLCLSGIDDPIVDSQKETAGKAWVLTEVVNEVLRVFSGEIHINIEVGHVTFYNRWFAIRIPKE